MLKSPSTLPTAVFINLDGYRPLPHSGKAMQILASGFSTAVVVAPHAALSVISQSTSELTCLILNGPHQELLQDAKQANPRCITILATDFSMENYSHALGGLETELVDHVIANYADSWCVDEIRVTLQKLRGLDIFGLSKHLHPQSTVHTRVVKGSQDRDLYNHEVAQFVETCGFGKSISRLAFGIAEEMLMNSIYDAPVAGGRTHYEELPRTEPRQLQEDEFADFAYGTDGQILGLSITDPFGAFRRDKFLTYLKKVLRRHDSSTLIDTKRSGAGLGLFKIFYNSHGIVCNVDPGKRTEVIALIDLTQPMRDFSKMARSIHYFSLAHES